MVVEHARLPPETAGGRRAAREPGAPGRSRRRWPQPGRGRPRRPVSHPSGSRARGGDRWQVAQRGQGVAPVGWAPTTMETDDQFVVMNLIGLHMHAFWYSVGSRAGVPLRRHCAERSGWGLYCMATYLGLYGDIFVIFYSAHARQGSDSPFAANCAISCGPPRPPPYSMVCSHCGSAPPAPARRSKSAVFARARGVGSAPREKRPPPPPARAHAPGACARSTEPNRSSLTPIIVLHHHHSWLPDPAPAPDPCSSRFAVLAVRAPVRSGGSNTGFYNPSIHPSPPPRGSPCCAQRLLLRRAALALGESAPGQLFPPRPRAQLSRARRVPGEGDAGRCPACVSPCGGTLAATRRARGTR